tara:strand:- start:6475 stop:7239 length:765 start_codon:yes stop_codon:yes gene_type:complete
MMTEEISRIIWITGAGKGIGRELAKHYAVKGWTVAVSARTLVDLQSLVSEMPVGRVKVFPLDVTDGDAVRETLRKIEDELGPLDTVILNAGTHVLTNACALSVDDIRHLVDTNFMGTVNGIAAVLDVFKGRSRGHIAVVASLAGYRGLPGAAAYGATKAGLINFCEAMKPDLEKIGVKLTLINPGFVDTPLTAKNDFPMPFLINAEDAALRIAKALDKTAFEITFPRRLVFFMKLLRILPDRLFFMLTRRMLRE